MALGYAELRSDVRCKPKKIPVIICNIIVIEQRKPRFQKEFIWRGQGYDWKWDWSNILTIIPVTDQNS